MSEIRAIGHIYNDYKEKFGIPRQSGLAKSVISKIVFQKEYSSADFFKGIEQFSHIWILWQFSENVDAEISPLVRPPKLGGNTRMGVFSTRSPFRPNSIGLSSVTLEKVDFDEKVGTVLYVGGADLMNGTPIIDIKPYLPYSDCHTDATGGFALQNTEGTLKVVCPENLLKKIPENKQNGLLEALSQDPRPAYQNDAQRIYGMNFSSMQVKFRVNGNELIITEIL